MSDDIYTLALELGRRLSAVAGSVATAESCTGGGIAEAITRIPGSSAWFELGLVTYSNHQKVQQLGVPAEVLAQVGAVSREVVEAMLEGVLLESGAQCAVAVSGIAGPDGGTADKPVGTVWIAWGGGVRRHSECLRLAGDRAEVRTATVVEALQRLIDWL